MKILNLSLDKKIMDKASAVAKRMAWFGDIVDRYTIVIPFFQQDKILLAEGVRAYGSGGTARPIQFFLLDFVARRLILRDEGYDVITVQDPYFLGILGLVLSRQFQIPLEVQVHGWEQIGVLKRLIRRVVLKRATGVRVVSERMKKDVMACGVSEQRITVVSVYTDVRLGEKKSSEVFTFITVARLVWVKRILMQLSVAATLKASGHIFQLIIVGDGEERISLETRTRELNLLDIVHFVGWKDAVQLADLYAKSDCLLLTSDSEGWGRVILEAGSYGVPSIMTDVGMAGEVIHNGKNGVVIPVGDQEALVEAMKRVMMDTMFYNSVAGDIKKTVQTLPTKAEILFLYVNAWKNIV